VLGLPPPPLPLCLPCLLPSGADEPGKSAPPQCECWAWCFPRRPQQRKRRLLELTSWRRGTWPGATSAPGSGGGGAASEAGAALSRRLRRAPNPLTQDVRLPCGLLPSQVSELLDRDITPDDYEMLLQLDEGLARPTGDTEAVAGLTTANAADFLGESCSVCLLAFEPKDAVAALQCKHPFHVQCISKWLLERCRWCPLCGSEAVPPA